MPFVSLLPVGSETTENWTVSQTTLVTWIRTKLGRRGTPEPGWGKFLPSAGVGELIPHKLERALLWKPKKRVQLHMSCELFSISLTQFLFFPWIRQRRHGGEQLSKNSPIFQREKEFYFTGTAKPPCEPHFLPVSQLTCPTPLASSWDRFKVLWVHISVGPGKATLTSLQSEACSLQLESLQTATKTQGSQKNFLKMAEMRGSVTKIWQHSAEDK